MLLLASFPMAISLRPFSNGLCLCEWVFFFDNGMVAKTFFVKFWNKIGIVDDCPNKNGDSDLLLQK